MAWPIRRSLDVECVDGVLVETEAAEGAYLDVDWSAGTASSVTPELSFEPGAFIEERTVVGAARVEIVQRGSVALDPAGCARFAAAFDDEVDCTVSGILRQALRPVDGTTFVPRADAAAFVFATENGNVARFAEAPVFYLPPEAPTELVEAAQSVATAVARVVPGFEIRPNDCREAALADAPFELPTGTLVERCTAYERLAPDAFSWQRPGGFASTIVWRRVGAPLGWGTFASRAVDADSGRIVAADVVVDATALDRIAARARRNAQDANLRVLVARAEARRDEVASTTTSGARVLEEGARPRPIEDLIDMLEVTRMLTTFDLTEDRGYAIVHAGPQAGSSVPLESSVYLRLPARIRASVIDGRAEAAQVMDRGYSFLPRWSHPGYGAVSALLTMAPDAHADLVVSGVTRHRLLHATLEALGLRDNPAGSWDGDTSVMDVVVAERQHAAVELGTYDAAALAYLYADGPRADALARCEITTALTTPTLACAIDDAGTTARASFAHAYGRWLGHYPITHVVDESLGFEPSPHDVLRPVIDAFWRASIAGQEASYRYETDVDFATVAVRDRSDEHRAPRGELRDRDRGDTGTGAPLSLARCGGGLSAARRLPGRLRSRVADRQPGGDRAGADRRPLRAGARWNRRVGARWTVDTCRSADRQDDRTVGGGARIPERTRPGRSARCVARHRAELCLDLRAHHRSEPVLLEQGRRDERRKPLVWRRARRPPLDRRRGRARAGVAAAGLHRTRLPDGCAQRAHEQRPVQTDVGGSKADGAVRRRRRRHGHRLGRDTGRRHLRFRRSQR